MRCIFLYFFFNLLCTCIFSQASIDELTWLSDTSKFTKNRGLPGITTEHLKEMPFAIFDSAKTREFAYRLGVGLDRRILLCCITAHNDSIFVGIDRNIDTVIQASEIYGYSAQQFKSEDLVINFSIKVPSYEETYCSLASFKKTSLKLNFSDSILNLNPLYLQTKHYMRCTFIVDGVIYHVVAMNLYPTIGLSADFQYLITKAKVEDSSFLKILKWSQDNDTILVNAEQVIVARRKSETELGFDLIKYKGLYGSFVGAKMPTITAKSVDGSVLQIPMNQPGKLNLIEFWGTWCGPCIALYPRFDSLLVSNSNFLTYTGVASNEDKAKVVHYIQKKHTIQRQIFESDANRSIISIFKIQAFPSFLLVDEKGIIVLKGEGMEGFNQVLAKVEEVKSKSQKTLNSN